MSQSSPFTHLNASGQAHMVDVTGKDVTLREASAYGFVRCSEPIMAALSAGEVPKGDALAVARIAGIAAAKETSRLLPLAHPIPVYSCEVDLDLVDDGVVIGSRVRTVERTGIEMEALTAVTVAALNLIDMVKGIDRLVSIEDVHVLSKSGGRSGCWVHPRHRGEDL